MSEEPLTFCTKAAIVLLGLAYLGVGWAIWFKEDRE